MSEDLVNHFYESLTNRDGDAMASCYAEDIVFEDPAFGVLRGADAGDMWRMLCASDTDLALEHKILGATETSATVNWIARYTFTATGRAVVNDVTAQMTIRDGKIVDHRDSFDFWKWSSQALGMPGKLLGWTPILKAKVRKTTSANLAEFQQANP